MTSFRPQGAAFVFLFVILALLHAVAAVAADADTPDAVEMPVSNLVPADLFEGTEYQLHPTATVTRARAFFEVVGPTGTETIVGVRELRTRRDEITAVNALREMAKTSVYGDALKKAGSAPVNLAKNLATSPVDTTKKIGRGIGGFFSDIGYSITGDDPDQENAAKTALGFGAAKRAFAYELGVNSYSRFEPLTEELGEVAWTSVGGSFTVSLGFKAIGGTPATVLSVSKLANGMRKLVRDNSPRKLKNINADKLAAMGIGEDLIEALLSNQQYDPEAETRFVGSLESMSGTVGRERFVKRAALVSTRADATLMRDWAELFAAYNDDIAPIKEVIVVSSAPLAVLDGEVVLALYPSDYALRTAYLEAQQRVLGQQLNKRNLSLGTVWLTGGADEDAVEMLEDIGWREVKTGVEDVLFVGEAEED